MLKRSHSENENVFEIGVDEAGRGPLFGRVYSAAVLLPKDEDEFDFSCVKDSKKFTSKKKLLAVAEYIKEKSIAWAVAYEDEKVIDNINILQATQSAMHKAITECMEKAHINMELSSSDVHLLIDGNYFNNYIRFNKETNQIMSIPHTCIKGGDNTYSNIAAASVLAKTSRDAYIEDLCDQYPSLDTNYCIRSNKGYGAKQHMAGIKEHGITPWHRKSFAPCKDTYFDN